MSGKGVRKCEKRLSVLVDTITVQPNSGGIRVYLQELLRALSAEHEIDIEVICSRSNLHLFKDIGNFKVITLPFATTSTVVRVLAQQIVLPFIVHRKNPEVFFEPVDVAPLAICVPMVTSVHSSHLNAELGYAGGLRSFYNKHFLGATLKRARAAIMISGYVRRGTKRIFDIESKSLPVVYHGGGVVEKLKAHGWLPTLDHERNGDILFVGSLQPYKRVDALLHAYARVVDRNRNRVVPRLNVVGKSVDGSALQLQKLAQALGIEGQVEFLGQVSDKELIGLYEQSKLMVLPSEIEGFGLPVIEAMQAGIPVVISNRCALPEIGGDAALVADPDDFSRLAQCIETGLWEPAVRRQMIERGFVHGERFGWAKCAQETFDILRSSVNRMA